MLTTVKEAGVSTRTRVLCTKVAENELAKSLYRQGEVYNLTRTLNYIMTAHCTCG